MIEFFENIDRKLFLLINGCHSDFADFFFFWVSNKYTWIPFYILLLFLCFRVLKNKWWLLLIFIPLLITATDQISVHLFKNVFLRYRPCQNLELKDFVHLVNGYCGGKYGFISSHAANSFGLAIFVWLILRRKYRYWFWILFAGYAGLIGYSRIYLGAHYPADVFVGALVGIAAGTIFYLLFRWVHQQMLTQKR
ncbi:MAG TPA: phosphatase PAP2 family protein [Bacteroidales bacterium]|nr:phosphatase PAP2 family protein [Bacteroidales bacterium]